MQQVDVYNSSIADVANTNSRFSTLRENSRKTPFLKELQMMKFLTDPERLLALECPQLRPKVRRVLKLDKQQRAYSRSNPFKLNQKDFNQLRWLKQTYVPKFKQLWARI